MRIFIGVLLGAVFFTSTVYPQSFSDRTRTGGAADIIKAKVLIIFGISEVTGILRDAAVEVKSAQSVQKLSDIILYTGKKFRDIMGLMKKSAQPYEDAIEDDNDFMETGQALIEEMMRAYTEFQDAVTKWREGKTLSPQDEQLLLDAVKALSSFEEDE
jgi:hypothetical protein